MKRILYTLNRLGIRGPLSIFLFLASLTGLTHAQVPGLLSYQGRVFSGAAAFEGNGQFKFALLNADGSVVYLLNHPDGNGDGQPDNAVTVGVTRGLYSVLLGDSSLPNMAGIAPSVFSNSSVHLRVWFNDGTSGFQQLTPDQRLAAVGYALMAAGVADGVITEQKLSSSLSGTITGLNQQIQALSARLDGLLASGLTVASSSGADSSLLAQGFDLFSTVPAPAWANGNTAGAASARYGHTAVWTGSQMVVWGGSLAPGVYSSSGSIYTPLSDVWTPVSPVAVPSARTGHSAIWTGQKMLVWGGFSANGYLNSGGGVYAGIPAVEPDFDCRSADGAERAGRGVDRKPHVCLGWQELNRSTGRRCPVRSGNRSMVCGVIGKPACGTFGRRRTLGRGSCADLGRPGSVRCGRQRDAAGI